MSAPAYNPPIVARCKKCGREFIQVGAKRPERDPYFPQGTWPTYKRPRVEICNGEIEYFEFLDLCNPQST